jgi:hypothetical protein
MLVRIAVLDVGLKSLERTLAQGEPPDRALMEMQGLLEHELAEPILHSGMRGERAAIHGLMIWLESEEGLKPDTSQEKIAATMVPGFRRMKRAEFRFAHAELLRYLTKVVEAAKQPADDWRERIQTLEQEATNLPWTAQLFEPAITRTANAGIRIQAQLRCAHLAVAAERFRRVHGRWPKRLSELAPRFVKEISLDPFDGRPLRSVYEEGIFTIHSVGPDGTDDNGMTSDLAFQLWDPARRRQPPETP